MVGAILLGSPGTRHGWDMDSWVRELDGSLRIRANGGVRISRHRIRGTPSVDLVPERAPAM